jgi:TatD DNase family protein
MLIDTHCHIDYLLRAGNQLDDVLADATAANVGLMINPGTCVDHWPDVLAVAEASPRVFAAMAIHPTDVDDRPADWLAQLQQVATHPKVVAIGETGLDYYRPEQQTPANMAAQRACMEASLDLACQLNKPVILHDREAHADIEAVVRQFPKVRGVMHCFSGDVDFALRMIELGFYISFAGNVTFKNAHGLQQAATAIPLERLLVETDSPFLSPMPHRGTPNAPARVALVAAFIAQLRQLSIEAVTHTTTANARQLFALPMADG